MSSILKALKKLEGETPQPDEDGPITQRFDPKRAINRRTKGTWFFSRILLLLCVLILLGIGGFIGLNDRFKAKKSSLESISPKPASPGTTQEEKKVIALSIRKTPTQPPIPASRKEPPPIKDVSVPEKEPQPEIPHKQRALTGTEIEKPEPPSTESRHRDIEKQEPTQGGFDESKFKLEAIVWSNNPKSRFAVINGRIVRPGGTIEGVSVIHIGRDYVAVQSRDGEGKLRFTID